MTKKTLLAALATAFLLVGAGCQNRNKEAPSPSSATQNQTPVTTGSGEDTKPITNEFSLQAASTATGTVKATWVAVATDDSNRFRVLHSTKEIPVFPGAYWTQYTTDTKEAIIVSVPSGTRYFRLCEFKVKTNECARYSEVIEVIVP